MTTNYLNALDSLPKTRLVAPKTRTSSKGIAKEDTLGRHIHQSNAKDKADLTTLLTNWPKGSKAEHIKGVLVTRKTAEDLHAVAMHMSAAITADAHSGRYMEAMKKTPALATDTPTRKTYKEAELDRHYALASKAVAKAQATKTPKNPTPKTPKNPTPNTDPTPKTAAE